MYRMVCDLCQKIENKCLNTIFFSVRLSRFRTQLLRVQAYQVQVHRQPRAGEDLSRRAHSLLQRLSQVQEEGLREGVPHR